MDSEEDNAVKIFMNLFNPAYAFTTFQMENILLMWTYYNNNKNIQNSFYLEANKLRMNWLLVHSFIFTL